MKKTLFILQLLLSISFFAQKHHRVKINLENKDIRELAQLGIEVDHGEYKRGQFFTSDLSENEVKIIKGAGFTYNVLIDDLSHYYEQRNKGWENYNPHKKTNSSNSCKTCPQFETPVNFNLGSMGGFFTYQEMLANLDSMAVKFPNLISIRKKIDTTQTTEGNYLYYVKISDNPSLEENESQILYTSLHHAREAQSLSQLIFYMWYLLENYELNDEIRYLVNNLEMYFIPCVNPDGYIYNQTFNPNGGGMWRKNRKLNTNGSFGVDLNRNYGEHWGHDDNGSSPNPDAETYRGSSAFSEIETQLVRNFCNQHQFKLALNNHTYSNLLIYPWGYVESFQTPDAEIFQHFAKRLTKCSGFSYGTANETVGYLVNGSSDDWMYGEQSTKPLILAMTPEAGSSSDGFWPAIYRIVEIAKLTMDQNLSLARLALRYAELEEINDPFFLNQQQYIKFKLSSLGLDTGSYTVSVLPLTTGLSVQSPIKSIQFTNHLQTVYDSVLINLPNNLNLGYDIRYVLALNNGFYTSYDTITKKFGEPIIAFKSDCSGFNEFENSNWYISTNYFVSANSSITDSPDGNYKSSENKFFGCSEYIDLTDAFQAYLSYNAKWDIEKGYDYAQLLIYDSVSYYPICGKYTSEGSQYQKGGQPIYDGRQQEWVKEKVDLSDFLGKKIKFYFELHSDPWVEKDGIYIDDITVQKIAPTIGIHDKLKDENSIILFPNPTSDWVNLAFSEFDNSNVLKINILDQLGRVIIADEMKSNETKKLNINQLQDGLYILRITNSKYINMNRTLVIQRR